MSNDKDQYSSAAKSLHWLIAILVIGMLSLGFLLDDIPEAYKASVYLIHKSTGISILFLMIIRFIWIHLSGKPALPFSIKLWEKILSRIVQYGFYVLLILMPLSGWIMSVAAGRVPNFFGLFAAPLPWVEPNKALAKFMATAHEYLAYALILFIIVHVLGALKHHFIDKDEVLKRMLP